MKLMVIDNSVEGLLMFRGRLLKTLASLGCQVIACVPQDENEKWKRLSEIGVEYDSISLVPAGMNPLKDMAYCLACWRLFRKHQPDLLLAYTLKPVIYGSLAARLAGVSRTYSTLTGLGYGFSARGLKQRAVNAVLRALLWPALRYNRRVLFLNADDRDLFLKLGLISNPDQAVVVNGSGVDLEHFAIAPFPLESNRFLMIARLIKEKGVLEYVQAARILKERYPDATFHLVGGFEPHPSEIRQDIVAVWQRNGWIQYHGWADDVRPFIANASTCVLPSYREGIPRSLLEALAMGRPIVTTDAPGCRETVIDGENGFLVAVRDVAGLAQAMERFLQEPALRKPMGLRSRELAVERYDVRKVNQSVLHILGLQEGQPGRSRSLPSTADKLLTLGVDERMGPKKSG